MRGFIDRFRREPGWFLLTVAAVSLLAVFLLWPLAAMLGRSLMAADGRPDLSGYLSFFSEPAYRAVLLNTLILGGSVTIASTLVGAGLALAAARLQFPLAGLLRSLPLVTLVIPDVVVAASWTLILGRQGLVNSWLEPLGVQLPSLYSWWGLIFVMTLDSYVYAFIAVYAGLKTMDRHLEEAALSLGRSPGAVLRGVTLPMMLPSLCAGALLVFTHVIGSFGIPAILGARMPVLAVKTYNEFVSEMGGSPQMQTTMASLLALLGLGMLLAQKLWVERRQYQMESGRSPAAMPIRGWTSTLAGGAVLLVVVVSLLPAGVVVVTAFTPSIGPVLHYGGFTLEHLRNALLQSPAPLYHSLLLAAVATVTGVLFAVVTAYLTVKRRSALTHALDLLVMLPLAVAGTVLGIALINAFNSGWLVLTGSWPIMALAYFLRRVPLSVRTVTGSLHSLKDSLEEAARSLGMRPVRSLFSVVLPAIGPSVAAAAVLMWVTSLSELSATIVLYFGGMSTMPIEIFQQVDSGRLAMACAYSLLLLLAIFIPLALARGIFKLKIGTME